MRANQKERLTFDDVKVNWHNSINEISPSSEEYTMLVAHEFFDALPIHMVQVCSAIQIRLRSLTRLEQKADTGQWREVLVTSNTLDKSTGEESVPPIPFTTFRYVLSPTATPVSTVLGHSSPRFNELPAGSMLEVSPTSFRIAHKVGELLASGKPDKETPSLGGCGLIIDYGANHAFGNSLRVRLNFTFAFLPLNCCISGFPKPQNRRDFPRTRKRRPYSECRLCLS